MILLLLAVSARAGESGGFAELRASAFIGAEGTPWALSQRLRPTFEHPLSQRVALSLTAEALFAEGRTTQTELEREFSESALGPMMEVAGCTWPSPANSLLGVSSVDDYLRVERIYVDVWTARGDLRVGRQALNWGSAFMVNPTDPFPQVIAMSPGSFRAGVNAARLSLPLGALGQWTAVVGSDDAFTHPRAAARATLNAGGFDLSASGAWRPEADDHLIGLDLRGTFGVGMWAEGALHLGDGDPYEEVALGADYSLPVLENLVITAQYYRRGRAGSAGMSSLAASVTLPTCSGLTLPASSAPSNPFASPFSGTDYVMAAASLGVNPYVSAVVLGVLHVGDGSAMVIPTASWAPYGWLDLTLAAQISAQPWGENGEFQPESLVFQMEEGGPELDLTGLLPTSTLMAWTRASF